MQDFGLYKTKTLSKPLSVFVLYITSMKDEIQPRQDKMQTIKKSELASSDSKQ